MSDPTELYRDYPANLPSLSLKDLGVLHDYNETLIKAEAEAEILDMRQNPAAYAAKPPPTDPGAIQDAARQFRLKMKRRGDIGRTLLLNFEDKNFRWRMLYEQWVKARSNGPGLDLSLLSLPNASTTASYDMRNSQEILAVTSFLHRQAQQNQARTASQLNHNEFRVHGPSVSLLTEPSHGYSHPTIHFPSLSYVIHEPVNNPDLKNQGLMSVLDQIESRRLSENSTPPPSHSTPVSTGPTDNSSAIHPGLLDPPHSMSIHNPSQPPKNSKKGTKSKKPFIPTRRWSRTYLNQLMREHRPRNLPESVTLTDHIDVQNLPIQKLTPEYCTVTGENEAGETILFGAGTRVDVPFEEAGGGFHVVPAGEDTMETLETRPVVKKAPFRLVVRDQHGNIKFDMEWTAEVTG